MKKGQGPDLFQQQAERERMRAAPLAARMRPRSLEEFIGQERIAGRDRLLRRALEHGALLSLILWGPPGSGKTTLARLLTQSSQAHFEQLSAVSTGVADLRRVVQEAQTRLGMHGQRTVLFVDEIHRWNKAQQDAILPYVEDGTLVLIGATTENPSFEINSALLSRCRVVVLEALSDEDIGAVVDRAIGDRERGLGELNIELLDEARAQLINLANGDARAALNALEAAAQAATPDETGRRLLAPEDIAEAYQRRLLRYDKAGEMHFDLISALHKSVRDSDPDGALYWLGRMLEAGEDPLYLARRIIRMAVEDIGLADPQALPLCVAAQQAVHFIGQPEGELALAEAVVYLCQAPKSNALYRAYGAVRDDVHQTRNDPVPLYLRNAPTRLMRGLGYGQGYKYAHDFEAARVDQEHLPPNLAGRRYYQPTGYGFEAQIAERLAWREQRPSEEQPEPPDAPLTVDPDEQQG